MSLTITSYLIYVVSRFSKNCVGVCWIYDSVVLTDESAINNDSFGYICDIFVHRVSSGFLVVVYNSVYCAFAPSSPYSLCQTLFIIYSVSTLTSEDGLAGAEFYL